MEVSVLPLEFPYTDDPSAAFETFTMLDENPLSGHRKYRKIYNPNKTMREIHGRLVLYLRRLVPKILYATAFRPGCSPRGHIQRHRKNRFFYHIDLHDAFGSVSLRQMVQILLDLDHNLKEVELTEFLVKYCFCDRGLTVGGSCSPDLFNIYCMKLLDEPFSRLCDRWNIKYSRYGDDLTFSSPETIGSKKRKQIRQILLDEGFQINHRKSFVKDLEKGHVSICGLLLDKKGRIFLPKSYICKIRGLIYASMFDPRMRSAVGGRIGLLLNLIRKDLRPTTRGEHKILMKYEEFKKSIKAK